MNPLLTQLSGLSSAEEILAHLGVAYDERVVQVNRLHILQRFHQYLQRERSLEALDAAAARERARALLQRAHDDFVDSTAAREKVFKVFRDPSTAAISFDTLRRSLPSRVGAPDGALE
jgi:nitrogenase-stabilizing/protective protein